MAKKHTQPTTGKTSKAPKKSETAPKLIDTATADQVVSDVTADTGTATQVVTGDTNTDNQKDQHAMTDTQTTDQTQTTATNQLPLNANGHVELTRSDKDRSTLMTVYFVPGRPNTSVRFSKTLFPNSEPPATIEFLPGIFGVARASKIKETAEERKARLRALPKPTTAERLAKLEEKLTKMRAKATKEAAKTSPATEGQPVAQPEPETVNA